MIKRTTEMVLSIIGLVLAVVLQGLAIFLSFALLNATSTSEGMKRFTDLYNQSLHDAGVAATSMPNVRTILDRVHTFSGIFIILLIVTIGLTILGISLMKRHQKNVMAGFIFLITAVIVLFSTVMIGFIPALLYLIVAIMCWVRKPKNSASSL